MLSCHNKIGNMKIIMPHKSLLVLNYKSSTFEYDIEKR